MTTIPFASITVHLCSPSSPGWRLVTQRGSNVLFVARDALVQMFSSWIFIMPTSTVHRREDIIKTLLHHLILWSTCSLLGYISCQHQQYTQEKILQKTSRKNRILFYKFYPTKSRTDMTRGHKNNTSLLNTVQTVLFLGINNADMNIA